MLRADAPENFMSWDKSCETGEFFTQFLMWKVCCHRVQKVTVMCRKEDSQGFRSCVKWLVPGGREMAILFNVKLFFSALLLTIGTST